MANKTLKTKFLCAALFLFFSRPAFAQIKPAWGLDISTSMLFNGSGNYGWELLALYPSLGIQTDWFRLSAFGGGGLAASMTKINEQGDRKISLFNKLYGAYSFGGCVDAFLPGGFGLGISLGGGMAGPNLADESKNLYPFVRAAIGLGAADVSLKLHYDYNFGGNGYKIGLMTSVSVPFGGTPPPRPAPVPPPPPEPPAPKKHPTITPEELQKVELAYAETVRYIQGRGKRLYIYTMPERRAFIQQYQGRPDTAQVYAAKNTKLEWYNIRTTSQEDIVARAKAEPNYFMKVRMIHDWVADVFAYDYDLLWWMDNVSGQNAEFTLGKIIERQRGVCFEYAILFWFLLDAAGVDTYLICDTSEPGKAHAYNMVLINNTGYIIDTTWDSGNRYVDGKIVQFDRMNSKDYFMPGISQSYQLRGW